MTIPVLTYCNILSTFDNKSRADYLKSIDSRATRIVCRHIVQGLSVSLPSIASIKRKRACLLLHKCIDGKLCENFEEYFSLLSHKNHTRNNKISLNLSTLRTEFLKRSVYFSDAKLYNELLLQIRQLDSFEKFRNAINIFFNWHRRHWIMAFLYFEALIWRFWELVECSWIFPWNVL